MESKLGSKDPIPGIHAGSRHTHATYLIESGEFQSPGSAQDPDEPGAYAPLGSDPHFNPRDPHGIPTAESYVTEFERLFQSPGPTRDPDTRSGQGAMNLDTFQSPGPTRDPDQGGRGKRALHPISIPGTHTGSRRGRARGAPCARDFNPRDPHGIPTSTWHRSHRSRSFQSPGPTRDPDRNITGGAMPSMQYAVFANMIRVVNRGMQPQTAPFFGANLPRGPCSPPVRTELSYESSRLMASSRSAYSSYAGRSG